MLPNGAALARRDARKESLVRIETEPPGAQVFVDGSETPATGMTGPGFQLVLARGEHTIRVVREFYEPRVYTIRVPSSRVLRYELRRLSGTLSIVVMSPTDPANGAEIYIQEVPAGLIPKKLTLDAGQPHRIEFRQKGYEPWAKEVTLKAGESQNLLVTLIPQRPAVAVAVPRVEAQPAQAARTEPPIKQQERTGDPNGLPVNASPEATLPTSPPPTQVITEYRTERVTLPADPVSASPDERERATSVRNAGIGLLAAGLGTGVLAIVFAALGSHQNDVIQAGGLPTATDIGIESETGQRYNQAAIGLGVVAGIFSAIGAPLLITGLATKPAGVSVSAGPDRTGIFLSGVF